MTFPRTKAGRLASAALALLLATGAAPPPSPESQLLAADRAFAGLAAEKGQGYAFLAAMANDGILYDNGHAPVVGKVQAFRRLGRREPGTLRRAPETARISADGRMGWTTGRWLRAAPDGKAKAGGHYLTVWVKDGRGAWKVQAQSDAFDPAAKK